MAFHNCSSLRIYCEVESQPSEWSNSWNYSNRPVVWGFKGDFIAVNNAIPTKLSDLTNDSDFATNSSVDTKLTNKANKSDIPAPYTLPTAGASTKGGIYAKFDSSTGTLYLGTTPQ
jgi:hypothetical protein